MELAVSDLFRPRWSDTVHEEWITAVLRGRPDLTRAVLDRTREMLESHARDARVTGFEPLIEGLVLPDENDRHVLAAAIKGRADLIVTNNLRDFPPDVLAQWDLEARHPDAFLVDQFHLSKSLFLEAVRTIRERLKNPPKHADQYLDALRKCGLVATAKEIEPYKNLI
ncbi:hypothetical protein GGD82_003380 [Roseospira marina]|nr:hypothetical protein [Roseospira marina]